MRNTPLPDTVGLDPLRIVLADDHEVVRAGLRTVIESQPDMMVAGEAGDGEAACRLAADLRPDVLVLDLSMPKLNGIEACRRVVREAPDVRVVVLTLQEDASYAKTLLSAGASAYVLKRSAADDLVRAIRTVAGGGTYIDTAIAGLMVQEMRGEVEWKDSSATLSDRERAVLIDIARGYSNKEIAGSLHLSVKTIETYKARFAEKLDLRSCVAIVQYAARHGWLDSLTDT